MDRLSGANLDLMGLFNGIMGNPSRVDPAAAAREYGALLAQGAQSAAA